MNPNYETTEVGGNLAGTSEHGRIYHFNEVVTGNPRFGIGYERYEALPDGWMEGKTIVDAIGRSFTVEHIVHTAAGTFTGDNAADEKAHPMLTMQVQGICPYGWHVANASDWLMRQVRLRRDIPFPLTKAVLPTSSSRPYQVRLLR